MRVATDPLREAKTTTESYRAAHAAREASRALRSPCVGAGAAQVATVTLACAIAIAVVFLVDVLTPLGFAAGLLYVPVVLLYGAHARGAWWVLVPVVCSGLTILGTFSATGAVALDWVWVANRAIAVCGIWLAACWEYARGPVTESTSRKVRRSGGA